MTDTEHEDEGDLADHPEEVIPVEPPEPGDNVDDE
jgi:hypothetical protein